jgi:hypothetical protein
MFLDLHLSTIPSYFVPKGSPDGPSIPQHGLNGQQQCTRINQTFWFFHIHVLLDPTLEESPQVLGTKGIIPQAVTRSPKEEELEQ